MSAISSDATATANNSKSRFGGSLARILLVLWTIGIWGSRVRNIVNDDELAGSERAASLAVALFLVVAACAVGMSMKRDLKWHGQALGVLVLAGIARFTIRGVAILASSEWEIGFKVVHTVLWIVTVILSLAAAREFSKVRSGSWVSS